jgi:hemerythrin superfamily protein
VPDIIDLVLHDYRTIEELFDTLQAASGESDQSALFAQVKEALEAHASAEEKVLYPQVRKDVPEVREESKDAIEEHAQIRESPKKVEEHEAGTELFVLAVAQLVATTRPHVGVEETELLPDFRNNSDETECETLGLHFEEAKAKAATS